MEEGNFAILYGSLYGVNFPNKEYVLTSTCFSSPAAEVVKQAEAAYSLAGVDVSSIAEMSVAKQADLKEACKKPELLPLAKSAYVYLKLKERGILPEPKVDKECESKEFKGQGIGVMVRYDGWIFIKKLSKEAEAYEVAGLLAAANEKFLEKMYTLILGRELPSQRKVGKLDDVVEELANAYQESYFKYLERALSYKGFRPYPYLQALVKAYPDLKPKKPRGRLPK